MKPSKAFWLLILLCLPGDQVATDLDVSGYFENRFFLIHHNSIPWARFNEKINIGDYNRLRIILNADAGERIRVNLAVDLFSFHGMIRSPLGSALDASDPDTVRVIPDRLFVDLKLKSMDIRIGKQRIPLGVSYLWAPLDVFGRVNIFEPKEEKPGVNAVTLRLPIGSSSGFTAVFSPEQNFAASTSALRAHTQLAGVDTALTLIHQGLSETTRYGLDLRGENLVGWWTELVFSRGKAGHSEQIVLGFDATLPLFEGIYWLSEFYYDSSGEVDPSRYDLDSQAKGERFTLGQTYLMSMLRYSPSELWSLSASFIQNFNDGSLLLGPALSLDLSQNLSLSGGLYLPFGAEASEFGRSGMHIFYLWLKINF